MKSVSSVKMNVATGYTKGGICVGLDWGTSSLTWSVYSTNQQTGSSSTWMPELRSKTIPSYLFFDPHSEQILYGYDAKEKLQQQHGGSSEDHLQDDDHTISPGNVIFDFLPLLGHKLQDNFVQEHLYLWPYKVIDISTQAHHQHHHHVNPLYRTKSKKFQSVRLGRGGQKGGAIPHYYQASHHRHHRHNDHLYFEGALYVEVQHNQQRVQYSIEDLLLLQLRHVLQSIEEDSQCHVEEMVIAVSNNLTLLQHRRLKDLVQQLGIASVHLETPSTIAFAALYLQQKQSSHQLQVNHAEKKVLICDIGSRSMCMSIAKVSSAGVVEVLSTSSTTQFGGEFITDEILKLMLYRCRHQLHDYHMIKDAYIIQQLRQACEDMKISLSEEHIVSMSLPHLLKHHWFVSTFTRKELEVLCQPLYHKLQQELDALIKSAKLQKGDVMESYLLGKTSKMPAIARLFQDYFQQAHGVQTLKDSIDVDSMVAQGCAIKALSLYDNTCEDLHIKNFSLKEVMKQAISLETIGGVASQIIPANTPLPIRKVMECTTNVDQQSKMLITLYEGNRSMIKDNILLYQHLVDHLPTASRSCVQFECILEVDEEFHISITFQDKHITFRDKRKTQQCHLECKDILSADFHYIVPSAKTSVIISTVTIDRPSKLDKHKAEIHLDPALITSNSSSKIQWADEDAAMQDIGAIYSASRPVSMSMSAAEIVSPLANRSRPFLANKSTSLANNNSNSIPESRRHSYSTHHSKTVFSKVRNLVDKFSSSSSTTTATATGISQKTNGKLSPTESISSAGEESNEIHDEQIDKEALMAYFKQTEKLTILTASLQLSVYAHAKTLDTLVGKTKECPTLVWLYPKKKSYRNWLEDPTKMLFTDTMMLVFICPVTLRMVPCGPKGLGYPVTTPKEFIRKWGPAILLSVALLHAGVMAGRVMGIPLPAPPSLSAITGGVFGSAFDALGLGNFQSAGAQTSLQQMWKTVAGIRGLDTQSAMSSGETLENALQQGNTSLPIDILKQVYPLDIMSDAYKSIHTFVTHGDNSMALEDQLRGKMERICGEDGEVDWVSEEGKQVWLAAHRLIMSPPTSPHSTAPDAFIESIESSPIDQTTNDLSSSSHSNDEFYIFLQQELHKVGLTHNDCETAYQLLQQESINSVLLWENLTTTSFTEILQEHKPRLKKGVETALLLTHQTLIESAHRAHGRKSMHQRGVNSLKPDELATLAALKHLEEKLNRLASASHINVNNDYSIDVGNGQMLYSQQATSSVSNASVEANDQVVVLRKSAMFRLQRQMADLEQQVVLLTQFLQEKEEQQIST